MDWQLPFYSNLEMHDELDVLLILRSPLSYSEVEIYERNIKWMSTW